MLANEYHNRVRKVWALKKCVKALEDLQERFNPIFWDDDQVVWYLEHLRSDIEQLEKMDTEF